MKTNIVKTFLLGATLSLGFASMVTAADSNPLPDQKSRVSYAIGLNIGHGIKQQQGLEVDPEIIGRAIKDVLSGGQELLTAEQAKEIITSLQADMQVKQQAKATELAAKSAAFLAENKNQPGVKTLEATTADGKKSELQYVVLNTGPGPKPAASDIVTVNYRGTFVDGTEFDSSYKRGKPAEFPLNGVIRGWTAGLQEMNVGSKWKLFIPSELAYGDAGRPGIPPKSTLIFEVELISAKPAPKPAAAPAPAAPITSDIIKVPSAEEMKKGAKIEVIKAEDAAKAQK